MYAGYHFVKSPGTSKIVRPSQVLGGSMFFGEVREEAREGEPRGEWAVVGEEHGGSRGNASSSMERSQS